jgi:hypothetical protein
MRRHLIGLAMLAPLGAVAASWACPTVQDKITGTSHRQLQMLSDNVEKLGFPYEGGARLLIGFTDEAKRVAPMFAILSRGQFDCGRPRCKVRIRAEDEIYSVNAVQLTSSGLSLMLTPAQLVQLQTSRTLKIETPVYQEGMRVWEFATDSRQAACPAPEPASAPQ